MALGKAVKSEQLAPRERRTPHRQVCICRLPLGPSVSSRLCPGAGCRSEAISGDPLGIIYFSAAETIIVSATNTTVHLLHPASPYRHDTAAIVALREADARPFVRETLRVRADRDCCRPDFAHAQRHVAYNFVSSLPLTSKISGVRRPNGCRLGEPAPVHGGRWPKPPECVDRGDIPQSVYHAVSAAFTFSTCRRPG